MDKPVSHHLDEGGEGKVEVDQQTRILETCLSPHRQPTPNDRLFGGWINVLPTLTVRWMTGWRENIIKHAF